MSNRKTLSMALLVAPAVGVVIFLIWRGYSHSWTGLPGYVDAKGEWVQPKKLWDWMELLLVPVLLAMAAYYLNQRQKKNELQRTANQQQEAALQNFITQMSELLLKNGLRQSKSRDEVRNIARARALTVLHELDGRRKGLMTRFLLESELIQRTGKTIEEEFETPVIDLTGANLRWADLSNADLSKAVFRGVDLRRADFKFSNLKDVETDEKTRIDEKWALVLHLKNKISEWTDLRGKDLRDADLSNVSFLHCDLRGADLRGAILKQAQLYGAQIDKNTKFDSKWLLVFKFVNDREFAIPTGADFDDADLTHVERVGKNFSRCTFQSALLTSANFTEAIFTEASLSFADARKAKFVGANLGKVTAVAADFTKADFTNAHLTLGDFVFAKFNHATLSGAILRNCGLHNTDLTGAKLSEADLGGADLTDANLTDVLFTNAVYDQNTKWPEGFDPTKKDLKLKFKSDQP